VCTEDKCPHRGTRLSEGQVDTKEGRIECLYHGWKFEGATGKCVSIPQLPVGGSIPAKACLKTYATAVNEGILYVWMYKPETADYVNLPKTCVDLDSSETKKLFSRYDFQYDLPYDHSYLVENLLDPAHIPVSHDKTEGGGLKENAQPFDMIIRSSNDVRKDVLIASSSSTDMKSSIMNSDGFSATNTRTRPDVAKSTSFSPIRTLLLLLSSLSNKDPKLSKSPILLSQEINFEAPGLIKYHSVRGSFVFGLALHSVPVGEGKCRLLFTSYFKAPAIIKFMAGLKPEWLRNLNSCKVLEQDVGIITSQEDVLMKLNTYKQYALNSKSKLVPSADDNTSSSSALHAINPADEWLPLSSSDTILVQYRKWLDSVGHGMPYYQGWRTRQQSPSSLVSPGDSQPAGTVYPHKANIHSQESTHRMHASRFYNHVVHHKPTLNALKKIIFCKHFFNSLLVVSSLASLSLINMAKFYSTFLSTSLYARLALCNNVFVILSVAASVILQKTENLFYTNFKRHDILA
jgi:phenylpropionate dioxygenase-like ring-hydroxylating dioxygenase large terminal subunit